MRLYGNSDRVGLLDYGSTIYVGGNGGGSTDPSVIVYNGLDSQSPEMALSAYMGFLLNSKITDLENDNIEIRNLTLTENERRLLSKMSYHEDIDTIQISSSIVSSGEVSAYGVNSNNSEFINIRESDWNSLLGRVAALEASIG